MAGDTREDGCEPEAESEASEGTDTLVAAFDGPATVEVGALGAVDFECDARHWHVDYLLGHPAAVARVVRTGGADVECPVGRTLAAEFDPVPGFGASDCDCDSHLVGATDGDALVAAVRRAHDGAAPDGWVDRQRDA
ncbi:MAG: DUF123 domain-containing protein [Haloarculaceae archaeon]